MRLVEEQTRDDIDLAIVLVPPVQVTGTIVDETGAPAAGIEVHALHSTASDQLKGKSDAEGRFVFERVFPGSWRLTARAFTSGSEAGVGDSLDRWAEATGAAGSHPNS